MRIRRSPAEIRFRIRQELYNLWFLAHSPQCESMELAPLDRLPDPALVAARLRGTAYAAEMERLAEQILQHDFPLLGIRVKTGPEILWRRDYVHQKETGTAYFRRIPYLDFALAGDHKIIWELNRHQHFVLLAQAWRLTGRAEFYQEIVRQLESWLAANPFQRGINWSSALEVAFRALSWIWIYHLSGEQMEEGFRRRFLSALYRHGLHLERNLSIYFSRNTHVLGEALALHALGVLFPTFRRARQWAETGARVVAGELDFQVRDDGSHFEQSSYYHVYALDMFLLHALLIQPTAAYRNRVGRMADYLEALLGPAGEIPLMGDDDGGRLFHPYGPRNRFGRATLATASLLLGRDWFFRAEDVPEQAAWWLGERALDATAPVARKAATSQLFSGAGLAVMVSDDLRVYADAGPLGSGRGGHGHSDALSLVVRKGAEETLIDPGTYTYVSDPQWRNRFRGSADHNTVRIDGLNQAKPIGPFGWAVKPEVEILEWHSDAAADSLEAVCRYAGFSHRRRIRLEKPDRVLVEDEIEGPAGEHLIEQFWHPGESTGVVSSGCFRIGSQAWLMLEPGVQAELSEGGEYGWRSPALGVKVQSPVIRVVVRGVLPVRIRVRILFQAPPWPEGRGEEGAR